MIRIDLVARSGIWVKSKKVQKEQKHKEIKEKVAIYIKNKGFDVCLAGDDNCEMHRVKNPSNIGDGEDKYPDVEGLYAGTIFQRGVAKAENDIDTLHSITQYKLFARRGDLVIGVPRGYREKLEMTLKENLTEGEIGGIVAILEF